MKFPPRAARRLATVGLLLGAVVALAAAPAGALTDPEDWGDTFCTETTAWLNGATAGANQLGEDASDPNLKATQGKSLLVNFLSTGVDATKSFGSEMKSAGVPKVTNGAKVQAAILAGIAGSTAKLTALEKAAKALPTKSTTLFEKGATKISQQLSTFTVPFNAGVKKATQLSKNDELSDVLSSLPSCSALANLNFGS